MKYLSFDAAVFNIMDLVRFTHNWNVGTMEQWNIGFWETAGVVYWQNPIGKEVNK